MRIAWIDHKINDPVSGLRETFGLVMIAKYGIELDGAKDWDELKRLYGDVNYYDGLLIHPGIDEQKKCLRKIRRLRIPVAFLTNCETDYTESKIPFFSYSDKNGIVQFFRESQTARGED